MRRFPLLMLLVVAALCSGCTLITNFDECSTTADCASGVCEDRVCVAPSSCATTAECADGATCIWGACHVVDESMCTVPDEVEPAANKRTLHVGLLLPYTGRNADKADATGKSAQTAFLQINGTHDGVRSVHLGAIACDTQQNSDRARTVADYLVNTLGVQSIIGSISSPETLAIHELTKPAGVAIVTPAATSPAISSLDDNNLVWRTIASDALQGPAIYNIVRDGGYTKVLLLVLDDTYGQGLFNAFIGAKDDTVEVEAINYAVDAQGDLVAESVVDAVTNKLAGGTYLPEAIVVMGSLESQQLIYAIDDVFFGDLSEEDRPVWILSEAGRDRGLLRTDFQGVWSRLTGTIVQTLASPIYDDFALRLDTNYGITAEDHQFADKAYDAAWLVALAHGAYDDPTATTGSDVAAALAKTAQSQAFSPGDDLATALNRLRDSGIDYQGASGPVDFDPTTGDVQSEISQWVITVENGTPSFETTGVIFTP